MPIGEFSTNDRKLASDCRSDSAAFARIHRDAGELRRRGDDSQLAFRRTRAARERRSPGRRGSFPWASESDVPSTRDIPCAAASAEWSVQSGSFAMSVVTTGSPRYTAVPHVAARGPTTMSSIASRNSGGIVGAQADTQRDAVVVDQMDGALDAGALRFVKPRDAARARRGSSTPVAIASSTRRCHSEPSSARFHSVTSRMTIVRFARPSTARARDAEVDGEGRSIATLARRRTDRPRKACGFRAPPSVWSRATRRSRGGRRRNQVEDRPSNRVGGRVAEHRFRRAVDHGDGERRRRR